MNIFFKKLNRQVVFCTVATGSILPNAQVANAELFTIAKDDILRWSDLETNSVFKKHFYEDHFAFNGYDFYEQKYGLDAFESINKFLKCIKEKGEIRFDRDIYEKCKENEEEMNLPLVFSVKEYVRCLGILKHKDVDQWMFFAAANGLSNKKDEIFNVCNSYSANITEK